MLTIGKAGRYMENGKLTVSVTSLSQNITTRKLPDLRTWLACAGLPKFDWTYEADGVCFVENSWNGTLVAGAHDVGCR